VNLFRKKIWLAAALFVFAAKQSASACATCYGASDSPLAQGMNWGIMVLLGFISCVLLGVTSFFIYIVRRANTLAETNSNPVSTDSQS
jgi:heme/copper-type cytochrome/quinol oxidase subunit 2